MLSGYLTLSFFICLLCSIPGFFRIVYFVGVCYGGSIAAEAFAAAVIFRATLAGWALAQVLLLFGYGIRLAGYLVIRNMDRDYQRREASQAAKRGTVGVLKRIGIWVGVAALYVLMALPVFLTLTAAASGLPLSSLPAGVVLMAIGLLLESIADWQKFHFKAAHPGRFCDTGLYRVVRCPNYLGEMVFWSGLWISALGAYHGWVEWLLCAMGLAAILGIMIGATRRLEGEQAERYGTERAYTTYRRTVPVLLPFLPLYSLCRTGAARR